MMRHNGALILLAFLCGLMLLASFIAMAAPARAEGVTDAAPTAPYTWELLATIGGATAATLLIVQFLKLPLDKVWKIPTRIWVLVIAFLILAGAQATIQGLTWPDVPLMMVNAFVVALAAMGAYEVSFAKMGK